MQITTIKSMQLQNNVLCVFENDTVIQKSYICGPASSQTEPKAFRNQISLAVTQLDTYNKVCNMLSTVIQQSMV